MTKSKKGRSSSEKLSNAHQLKLKINNNSLNLQRQRILEWLGKKSLTTLEARHQLDILAPAARMFELRHIFGFNILTCWQVVETQQGRHHRVAQYVLLSGRYQRHGGKRHV